VIKLIAGLFRPLRGQLQRGLLRWPLALGLSVMLLAVFWNGERMRRRGWRACGISSVDIELSGCRHCGRFREADPSGAGGTVQRDRDAAVFGSDHPHVPGCKIHGTSHRERRAYDALADQEKDPEDGENTARKRDKLLFRAEVYHFLGKWRRCSGSGAFPWQSRSFATRTGARWCATSPEASFAEPVFRGGGGGNGDCRFATRIAIFRKVSLAHCGSGWRERPSRGGSPS